jgi:hypothetical protein
MIQQQNLIRRPDGFMTLNPAFGHLGVTSGIHFD